MPLFTPLAKKLQGVRQEPLPGFKLSQQVEKKKVREQKRNSRRVVVAIFLSTVLACSFFYLKTEAPVFWEKLTAPAIISSLPVNNQTNSEVVLERIEALTQGLRGDYAIFVYRLQSGEHYGIKESESFPAASLIKLPVIISLYQQAEAGVIDLETEYTLEEEDKVGGAGVLQSKPSGSAFSYRQLVYLMGQASDNTAFKVIKRILGDELIQATIDQIGMRDTSLEKNETTAVDISLLFQKLYQNKLVSVESKAEILGSLTETDFENRIPTGVPTGTRVAHKIGTELGVFSDAGIVFSEQPFVLVILSQNARESEADQVLPAVTRAVWEFEQAK